MRNYNLQETRRILELCKRKGDNHLSEKRNTFQTCCENLCDEKYNQNNKHPESFQSYANQFTLVNEQL